MSILAILPLNNQENRIQPLFKDIKGALLEDMDKFLFLNENSNDNPKKPYELERHHIKCDYNFIDFNHQSRAKTFKEMYKYALDNNFDYLLVINEGWQDNIEEINNIIKSKEYKNFDLVVSKRNVYNLNLGSIFDFISKIYSSLLSGNYIYETKGDSINIVKIQSFKDFYEKLDDSSNFFYKIILWANIKNLQVLYTDVDNGLNFRSYIKLNLNRFLYVLKTGLQLKLFSK